MLEIAYCLHFLHPKAFAFWSNDCLLIFEYSQELPGFAVPFDIFGNPQNPKMNLQAKTKNVNNARVFYTLDTFNTQFYLSMIDA